MTASPTVAGAISHAESAAKVFSASLLATIDSAGFDAAKALAHEMAKTVAAMLRHLASLAGPARDAGLSGCYSIAAVEAARLLGMLEILGEACDLVPPDIRRN